MIQDIENMSNEIKYQLLDRMKQDCKYYLSYGNRQKKYLWSGDEWQHIEDMKQLYFSFDPEERPEWLTAEDIKYFKKAMVHMKSKESSNTYVQIRYNR